MKKFWFLFFLSLIINLAAKDLEYDFNLYFKVENRFSGNSYIKYNELEDYGKGIEKLGMEIKHFDEKKYFIDFKYQLYNQDNIDNFNYIKNIDIQDYRILLKTVNLPKINAGKVYWQDNQLTEKLTTSPIEMLQYLFNNRTILAKNGDIIEAPEEKIHIYLIDLEGIKQYFSQYDFINDFYFLIYYNEKNLSENEIIKSLTLNRIPLADGVAFQKYTIFDEKVIQNKLKAAEAAEKKKQERLQQIQKELAKIKQKKQAEPDKKEKVIAKDKDAAISEIDLLHDNEIDRKLNTFSEKIGKKIDTADRIRLKETIPKLEYEANRKIENIFWEFYHEKEESFIEPRTDIKTEKADIDTISYREISRKMTKVKIDTQPEKQIIKSARKTVKIPEIPRINEQVENLFWKHYHTIVEQDKIAFKDSLQDVASLPKPEISEEKPLFEEKIFQIINTNPELLYPIKTETPFQVHFNGPILKKEYSADLSNLSSSSQFELKLRNNADRHDLELNIEIPRGYAIEDTYADTLYSTIINIKKKNNLQLNIRKTNNFPIIFIDKSEILPISWIGIEPIIADIEKSVDFSEGYGVFYISGEKMYGQFSEENDASYKDYIWDKIYPLATSSGIRFEHISKLAAKWKETNYYKRYYPTIHLFLSRATLKAFISTSSWQLNKEKFTELKDKFSTKRSKIVIHSHIEHDDDFPIEKMGVYFRKIR